VLSTQPPGLGHQPRPLRAPEPQALSSRRTCRSPGSRAAARLPNT